MSNPESLRRIADALEALAAPVARKNDSKPVIDLTDGHSPITLYLNQEEWGRLLAVFPLAATHKTPGRALVSHQSRSDLPSDGELEGDSKATSGVHVNLTDLPGAVADVCGTPSFQDGLTQRRESGGGSQVIKIGTVVIDPNSCHCSSPSIDTQLGTGSEVESGSSSPRHNAESIEGEPHGGER